MKSDRVRVRLLDIRAEIAGIRQATRGVDVAAFSADWQKTRAVQHALLIIAEAAKNVPPSIKQQRPEVPWRKIHGLGNLLRHEYQTVDTNILWSIVTEYLDDLDVAVAGLIEGLDST